MLFRLVLCVCQASEARQGKATPSTFECYREHKVQNRYSFYTDHHHRHDAVNHVKFKLQHLPTKLVFLATYSCGNMPADYSSTARALALPVSPQRSPVANHHPHPPPWTRRRSSQSLGRSQPSRAGFRKNLIDNAEKLQKQLFKAVKKLTPVQRGLAVVAAAVAVVVGILFLVFNETIFAWLEPIAESWKNLRGGWLILWAMTFTTAFPPVIGYSTCVTTAGFVYGFPKG